MNRTRALFISVLLFFSCCITVFADNTQLAEEVMAIHDEAMAKMTHMYELKLQLREREDKDGASPETTAAIGGLQNAHKSMMEWMRAYRAEHDPSTTTEAVTSYLFEEKQKIQIVSDLINESIDMAEKMLKK